MNDTKNAKLECTLWKYTKCALDDNYEIVGYGENKRKETVVVAREQNRKNLTYYLYGENYNICGAHPYLVGTICADTNQLYAIIDDISAKVNNIGNGSILLAKYIEYCKKIGVQYITGGLSAVDKEHFDRSEAFYKKHGFQVRFNDDRSSGNIKLDLQSNQ